MGKWVFFGPKKMHHNRRKIKLQSRKADGKTTEFMGVYSLFGSNCPVSKMSSLQHAFCQIVTMQMRAAKM
jgi:hypothetical protein